MPLPGARGLLRRRVAGPGLRPPGAGPGLNVNPVCLGHPQSHLCAECGRGFTRPRTEVRSSEPRITISTHYCPEYPATNNNMWLPRHVSATSYGMGYGRHEHAGSMHASVCVLAAELSVAKAAGGHHDGSYPATLRGKHTFI